jgi:hypothetical protein
MIQVEQLDPTTFTVRVEERRVTTHRVTLDEAYYRRVSGGRVSPEQLVRMSFEFLLEREPNTSILSQFALPVIERYFPEYVREMEKRIGD